MGVSGFGLGEKVALEKMFQQIEACFNPALVIDKIEEREKERRWEGRREICLELS